MSEQYDAFKKQTIEATQTITGANRLKAVTDEYLKGFQDAMWEAREIYMAQDNTASQRQTAKSLGINLTLNKENQ